MFTVVFHFSGYTTHIVGGELNYKYLGNDDYEIRLTVFRDCYNGVALFDDPAALGIFDSNNNLINWVSLAYLGLDTLPPAISSPCLVPPTNVCYEVTTYIDTINLPAISGGYQLAYQRCCRNGSIININNPGGTGATYYATIPDNSVATTNSNPVFKQWPPTFICTSAPFKFDHSAVDDDGDSLVYQLCTPFEGATSLNPMPQPPGNPAYLDLTWQSPYSVVDPFGGVPLTIDAQTGYITATPNTIGQFVYGVCVKEYRNCNLLGETKRDFQVNMVNCPNLVVASIQSPTIVCGSLTANFTNNSFGAATYWWDFGVTSLTNDTSNAANPAYTYPDTGYYHTMLVAYSGSNIACNDTSYDDVYVYPPFVSDFTFSNTPCIDTVYFTDASSKLSGNVNSWNWDFGDNKNSGLQDPTHDYSGAGIYNAILTVTTDVGCTDTVEHKVVLSSLSKAEFSYSIDSCKSEIFFKNLSAGATAYSWDFGDGDTINTIDPVHIYKTSGNYEVTLITDAGTDCADTMQHSFFYNKTESFNNIYIPNAITPNHDGRNDKFEIFGYNKCESYELMIFDRWGQLIFQTSDMSNFWDAKYKGKAVFGGVYVYVMKGEKTSRSGTITVIK